MKQLAEISENSVREILLRQWDENSNTMLFSHVEALVDVPVTAKL